MIQEGLAVSISIEWWSRYQNLLKQAIAPLTADQLNLRLGSQRSAGEIASHIVRIRAWYLYGIMGEGGADMERILNWKEEGELLPSTAELLAGIDQTWALLTDCLARWTPADMRDTHYHMDWLGYEVPRGFAIWHMLEHEIHHGGELSITLGSYGLAGVDV